MSEKLFIRGLKTASVGGIPKFQTHSHGLWQYGHFLNPTNDSPIVSLVIRIFIDLQYISFYVINVCFVCVFLGMFFQTWIFKALAAKVVIFMHHWGSKALASAPCPTPPVSCPFPCPLRHGLLTSTHPTDRGMDQHWFRFFTGQFGWSKNILDMEMNGASMRNIKWGILKTVDFNHKIV